MKVKIYNMKHFLLFFIAFYVFTRTCHGYNVTHLNVIFVNNVIDPDQHEIDQVKNFMALPIISIRNPAWSLMTNYGLLKNYSIIFSKEPDVVETIPSLELEHPAMIYHFENLINNCTSNSGNATLKGLRKALEMSSNNTIVFLVANKKTNNTDMLNETIHMMYTRQTSVIVLVVDKKNKTFEPIMSNMTKNFGQLAVNILEQDVEKLGQTYYSIMQATRWIGFKMAVRGIEEKFELDVTRPSPYELKNFAIVYDIIDPTEEEIANISESMKQESVYYFKFRYRAPIEPYSVFFSSKQDEATRIQAFENYTAKDFQDMIKSQLSNIPEKASLRALLKTLQTIPSTSMVTYYVNEHPEDQYEVLTEIVQLILDKKMRIDIKPIRHYAKPEFRLPVAYRTIMETSWRVRSSSSSIRANWITLLVIFIGLITVKFT